MTELAEASARSRPNHSLPVESSWQGPSLGHPLRLAWMPFWLALATILAALLLPVQNFGLWVPILLIGTFLGTVSGAYRIRDHYLRQATPQDLELLEDAEDPNTFLVQMHIVAEGAIVGVDRGILCFEENALLFSGHACSFCIGIQDVARVAGFASYMVADNGKEFDWSLVPLKWRGNLALGIIQLKGQALRRTKKHLKLETRLAAFLRSQTPTELERRYPPIQQP